MRKSTIIVLLTFICGLTYMVSAQAAMIQSLQQATTYDMFLPKNKKKIPNTADKKNSPSKNYNPAIARKLFNMSDGQKRTITIEEGTKRVHVAKGSKIRVVLDNIKDAKWYMECSKQLILINTKNEDKKIIMMFDTLAKGRAKIYLDCVDKSDKKLGVIKSKYINIVID